MLKISYYKKKKKFVLLIIVLKIINIFFSKCVKIKRGSKFNCKRSIYYKYVENFSCISNIHTTYIYIWIRALDECSLYVYKLMSNSTLTYQYFNHSLVRVI